MPSTHLTLDLYTEDRLTLTQLAREWGVDPATAWRWAMRGVRGVKLATFCVGGRTFTTRQAGRRFNEAVTAARNGVAPVTRTTRQREKAIERANREAERLGI